MRAGHQDHHLATVSHDGRFWDVYLEIQESDRRGPARGRLAFSAADDEQERIRTAVIFVEPSEDEVLRRAREFETHQLIGLLRSCLP
ncbi:MAG: hypothetical protein P8099_00210 [Gemmatimonadota bacterium]|jgi:hypothetical protein